MRLSMSTTLKQATGNTSKGLSRIGLNKGFPSHLVGLVVIPFLQGPSGENAKAYTGVWNL